MGRSLSFSLLAHAVFALSFLLLSATRKPAPLVPAARPVRLVTYLEPATAPGGRPAPRAAPSAPGVPEPPAPRAARAPAPTAAPVEQAAPVSPAAVAVPRVVVPAPVPGGASSRAPAPAAETPRPALGERLARRLSSAAPAGTAPTDATAPRIASLPRIDPAFEPPDAVPVPPAAGPSGQAVEPVGHFPHAWYLALLKEEIYARWSPPSEYFQSRRPPVALVAFRITRAGKIEAVALKEGSGSARFDQSALAAVRGLGAVPALPEQYGEESLHVIIRFQNPR